MLFVLYGKSGCHSGRALRKKLSEIHSSETVKGGYPKRFKNILAKEGVPRVVINLGTTDEIPFNGDMLNTQDMVRAASNKKAARRIFADHGIPAPALFLHASEVTSNDLPVIGRTSYHAKGNGFWFCQTKAAVNAAASEGATHFLKFVSNTREYRVHTFLKGKHWKKRPEALTAEHFISTKISEKVCTTDTVPNENEPQKNHAFGWTFLGPQDRREEELDVVRSVAKQAIASLRMDFGAVDVMYQISTKLPFVLEVNSTPSLADEQADTCERYAKRILKILGANEAEE